MCIRDSSLMLSFHLFLCLPCLLPPFIVPCKMVFARPAEQETCSSHFSLHLFTMVRRSSCVTVKFSTNANFPSKLSSLCRLLKFCRKDVSNPKWKPHEECIKGTTLSVLNMVQMKQFRLDNRSYLRHRTGRRIGRFCFLL